ncbi:Uncharacterised protein [uncultured archaeon]|nr:Uncharacterised protein [uncultured archaeon]
MSIIIFGDVHGYTKQYQKYLRQNLDPSQRTIQIGDMGLGFAGVGLHPMAENHKFFRGNHDSPAKCRAHKNYLGDYGYLELDGIFYLAGARSIDRAYRTEGVSWWADEELSYEELGKAIDLYKQVKPRFVLSHEAPAIAGKVLLHSQLGPYFTAKLACSMSRTAEAMQQMLDIHQPEKWIFGHYHLHEEFFAPGYTTRFIVVGGQMDGMDVPKTYELKT